LAQERRIGVPRFVADALIVLAEARAAAGETEAAPAFARLLEAYTRAEPLPWASFFIRRGRALAGIGRGRADAALHDELEALVAEAERAGLLAAVPLLSRAVASAAR
jgi:hypothetical protein